MHIITVDSAHCNHNAIVHINPFKPIAHSTATRCFVNSNVYSHITSRLKYFLAHRKNLLHTYRFCFATFSPRGSEHCPVTIFTARHLVPFRLRVFPTNRTQFSKLLLILENQFPRLSNKLLARNPLTKRQRTTLFRKHRTVPSRPTKDATTQQHRNGRTDTRLHPTRTLLSQHRCPAITQTASSPSVLTMCASEAPYSQPKLTTNNHPPEDNPCTYEHRLGLPQSSLRSR